MSTVEVNGTTLHVEDRGGDGRPLVLAHGLLWSTRMWDPVLLELDGERRTVAYDHRGQGRSARDDVPTIGMETLYQDAVGLIEQLDAGPVDYAGLSTGGFVGMRLAARRPDLVRRLVLLSTSADREDPVARKRYASLALAARVVPIPALGGPIAESQFSSTFLRDPSRARDRDRWRRELLRNDRSVIPAVDGVLRRDAVLPELGRIQAPTLVVVGDEDTATPPRRAERIAGAIPGARLVRLPRVGHTMTVEAPQAVAELLRGFLDD